MSNIRYLYGVVPAGMNLSRVPSGIDDNPVELVEAGRHGALVTTLDGHAYSPEKIELLAGNVDWIRPRAEAHDSVLNWASDTASVIPLPMWTLFGDAVAVRKMLTDRGAEFDATFRKIAGAREYTVRAYVRSSELQAHLREYSDDFASLEAEAAAASPGQRYLLERDQLVEFRRVLTEFVKKYQPSGFSFDFTGPWPPYHFVGGRAGR